ncbi:MAG: transcriptional repressor LexA [Candidatus Nealsonbacteria bacterium]|nr:MAG: transcriptional repressor LexA [Candidatus Nealsonbacteria bacterium]
MLTKRQKQILNYIEKFIKAKDYSPSLEEIKKHFRLASRSTIHQHIETLKNKGYLENQPRIIEVSNNKNSDLIKIPVLGTIAAGEPIEAIESPETIKVQKTLLSKSGEHYALRVQGNSMIDEGIYNGDVVILRKQPDAENGETVVALINDNEVTLKKIYKEKNGFRLQPANPNIKPIYTKELIIQGKVISVIRNFNELKEKIKTEKSIKPKKNKISKKKNLKKHLNKVFFGDIMDLLKDLPDESVNMVFGDPDYNVGIKYGDKTYTKNFNEYINWYIELTKESMRVLKKDGNLFMMNYPKQNAHLRTKYLDNIYPFINEYIWVYNTNIGHSKKRFTTAHRSILHVRKSKNNKFYKDNIALPYKNPTDRRILENLKNGSKGRMPYSWIYFDWFYFDLVKNVSKEKTYHACQIPQKLTEMLIKSCTIPNDIVFILFGGSGSELEVCKKLKRQYISTEIDEKYHEMILDRLQNGYIKKKYKLQLRNPIRPKESLSLFNKEE